MGSSSTSCWTLPVVPYGTLHGGITACALQIFHHTLYAAVYSTTFCVHTHFRFCLVRLDTCTRKSICTRVSSTEKSCFKPTEIHTLEIPSSWLTFGLIGSVRFDPTSTSECDSVPAVYGSAYSDTSLRLLRMQGVLMTNSSKSYFSFEILCRSQNPVVCTVHIPNTHLKPQTKEA